MRLVSTFGSLVANTDRHFGNLAFFDQYDGRFSLAPIYDMLPMLYAPEHDQLAARNFAGPDPSSANLREYSRERAHWPSSSGGTARRMNASAKRSGGSARAACASLEALPRTGAYVAI